MEVIELEDVPVGVLRAVDRALHMPASFKWTQQGFGMLRAYMTDDKEYRLHIWAPSAVRARQMGVSASDVHTHPWDFQSWVLAGTHSNVRYKFVPSETGAYFKRKMIPGAGAELLGEETKGHLIQEKSEFFKPGDSYFQTFDEIHKSEPTDGGVTLIRRDRADREDVADTFRRIGFTWVSAEPKSVSPDEVIRILNSRQVNFDENRRREAMKVLSRVIIAKGRD